MRLLIMLPDMMLSWQLRAMLVDDFDEIVLESSQPWTFDVVVLHHCLPGMDGQAMGDQLAACAPLCPPRVLFVAPPEFLHARPLWADAVLHHGVSVSGMADTIRLIAKKPLPKLAAAHKVAVQKAVGSFLDDLSLSDHLKGRSYAEWMLCRLIVSPVMERWPVSRLYHACADAFATSSGAVERCLRVAVESVFTQGSLKGIERFFGEAADPERGKLTNRAFLIQSCQWLRYSLTAARSPNKSEMHHSPAAPTRV
ncbi:MAG: sporulation initiation factor Spo0A C-terminal domain-containing protein [bacterium]|nr:sporulation initiation factor Spo0A C-terminal domain-containing protein [bacterium]